MFKTQQNQAVCRRFEINIKFYKQYILIYKKTTDLYINSDIQEWTKNRNTLQKHEINSNFIIYLCSFLLGLSEVLIKVNSGA